MKLKGKKRHKNLHMNIHRQTYKIHIKEYQIFTLKY